MRCGNFKERTLEFTVICFSTAHFFFYRASTVFNV